MPSPPTSLALYDGAAAPDATTIGAEFAPLDRALGATPSAVRFAPGVRSESIGETRAAATQFSSVANGPAARVALARDHALGVDPHKPRGRSGPVGALVIDHEPAASPAAGRR